MFLARQPIGFVAMEACATSLSGFLDGQYPLKRSELNRCRSNPADLLAQISPLGWARIVLTGKYRWPKKQPATSAYYSAPSGI